MPPTTTSRLATVGTALRSAFTVAIGTARTVIGSRPTGSIPAWYAIVGTSGSFLAAPLESYTELEIFGEGFNGSRIVVPSSMVTTKALHVKCVRTTEDNHNKTSNIHVDSYDPNWTQPLPLGTS